MEYSARTNPNNFSLPAQTVAATDAKRVSSSPMEELLAKIDTLTHRLENLELERRPPCVYKRNGSKPRTREANASRHCWYQAKYGDRASKCNKPCTYSSGKEPRRTWARHVPPADAPNQVVHFFVRDHVSNKSFMVDTGSSCSIWPLRLVSNKPKKSCISLHVVNLSIIDN